LKKTKDIKIKRKILLLYTLVVIFVGLIFKPFLPIILNYPPDSINNEFQKSIDLGFTYDQQYFFLTFLGYCIGWIQIIVNSKFFEKIKLDDYKEYKNSNQKMINKLFKYPFKISAMNLVLVVTMIISVYAISEQSVNGGTLKIALFYSTLEVLKAIMIFIYSKKCVSDILRKMDINSEYVKIYSSLTYKIVALVLPLILVALVLTSLIGYSRLVYEKGIYMFDYTKKILDENITKNEYTNSEIMQLMSDLKSENNKFIIFSDENYFCFGDEKLSEFFIRYACDLSETHEGRCYETYGIDKQAAAKPISVDGEKAFVGIEYDVSSIDTVTWFIVSILLLYVINCLVLYYVSRSLVDDTGKIAKALEKIVHNKNSAEVEKLTLTSNDELAALAIAFNEIQDLTKNQIDELSKNQYIMQRQAQFSILGEFAGGLAHDLNSPLSAVQLDISTLQKYIKSDKIQAEPEVKNVLNEMLENIDSSLNKMTKIIAGVRNQIRSTGDSDQEEFDLREVIEGIEILFGSILRKNNCKIDNIVDPNIIIYGEKNKLDRVIGNVIKNSIDAYVENKIKGSVVIFSKVIDGDCIIGISDEAGGLNADVAKTMFKEMKTTKTETGTGFGLYYSNTIIESSFKGSMSFETEEGKGTTFYIKIPMKREEV